MSSPTDVAQGVQALAAALLTAITDPADAIRLLTTLANFHPASPTGAGAVGQAMANMQGAVGDLTRRAAVVALARASATYQPSSYDDANAVRRTVCDLLEAEATIAGDQGEDQSFAALRSLRAAVSQDLTARGADLARLRQVQTPAPLPAPVLAQRLYRDPSRADELVMQADPIHPAFMPVGFKALAE